MSCSKCLEPKLYTDRHIYSRNIARKLSSQVVIEASSFNVNVKSPQTEQGLGEQTHTDSVTCTGTHSRQSIQGATQKFLDKCYKTQIISYMHMIYFYSSKHIPPWSIHLFTRSFNFFMPSRKAVFEMMLSFLVTAHWISSTVWKCRPFKEIFNLGKKM